MVLVKSYPALARSSFRIGACIGLSLIGLLGIGFEQSLSQSLFGDGSDGDQTIAGIQHLTREMNYANLTVNSGATLFTGGHTVRVSGILLNQGTITDSSSGGAGGAGGSGGAGGHLSGITLVPGATGGDGSPGLSGYNGAGNGGRGGGGGAGGGPAQDVLVSNIAEGGNGGSGGKGGKGGGSVRINARMFDNLGTIHANGFPGQKGQDGANGEKVHYYLPFNYFDMAGGGGGGGGGGTGGNGGTVYIVFDSALSLGTLTATGGDGAPVSNGGMREALAGTKSATATWTHGGNGGNYGEPGEGGGGLVGWAGASDRYWGGTGDWGGYGLNGSVTLVLAVLCYNDSDGDELGDTTDPGVEFAFVCGPGYTQSKGDNCPLAYNPDQTDADGDGIGDACCCIGTRGNVNVTAIIDVTDLALLVAFLANPPATRPMLPCPNAANVNTVDITDVTDLALLIAYLTNPPASRPLLPDCP